jgi:hypothetical protein
MTTTQLFFAIVGVVGAQTGFLVLYINAKLDPLRDQVNTLVQYMISHEGRHSIVEERTKKLPGAA